ncbi:transporter [Actinomyces gaoshouyii]|uniref:Transporter n=1 Tax=Actinomyces gaoshouyii TaxID=1960083 RepID=A0A8H9HBW2_9ACTO|nr:transporter [Actinomyces gaoshouyii]
MPSHPSPPSRSSPSAPRRSAAGSRYAPPQDLSKYAWLSIGAALATIALKSWAAWVTGSAGLLSDAAESLINLVAAVMALWVLKVSIRPADEDHQFGHSKAEYFSAVVEGVMIFVAAALIIVTATERIIHPVMPEKLGLGLAVSVIASLINGGVAWIMYRTGRAKHSATLIADAKHLSTDVITSAAVLIGVGVVALTGLPVLDALVALGAGLSIMWTGFTLINESVGGLMDAAPAAEAIARVEEVLGARREPDRIDFHAMRIREAGNRRFMDLHVLVPDTWTVKQGHDYTEDLIDDLVRSDPGLRVSAHLEPIGDPKSYEDLDDI